MTHSHEEHQRHSWRPPASATSPASTMTREPSRASRHASDVWRRVVSDWLAGLVTTGVVDDEDARGMAWDLAYGQAKSTYRLGEIA
jgi:hypothetical protein